MPDAPLRIATWNVNGLRARLDFVRHWLAARRPDVVGLQEVKAAEAQFPAEELAEAGYRVALHAQKGWNGVAVLVREPLEVHVEQAGLPGQEALGARLLATRVTGPGAGEDGLSFTSVYVPNGKTVAHEDFPRKLDWLDALAQWWAGGPGGASAAVLCGDFNVVPGELDTWNEADLRGRIFHTEEERARFEKLLGLGLVDLFRRHAPGAREFSWWDYRGGAFHRKQGLRIDFLLATPAVAQRVRAVEIDREYRKKKDGLTASDHAPVMADLE